MGTSLPLTVSCPTTTNTKLNPLLKFRFSHESSAWTTNHETTARNLAADRVTRLLPVLTAVLAFFLSVGFSFGVAATRNWNSRDPIHLTMHGLAFSMTLVGCLPAVMLAAAIGTPQTHLNVRRILCMFEAEAARATQRGGAVPNNESSTNHLGALHEYDVHNCLGSGAIPAWRPDRWAWITPRTQTSPPSIARAEAVRKPVFRELCAIIMVFIGCLGAIWLSASVPPTGCINCRIFWELLIMFSYFASYLLGVVSTWILRSTKRNIARFWVAFIKDIFSTLVVTALIVLTGVGSLNRHTCWITCDGIALCLPDMTKDVVKKLVQFHYPAIILGTFILLVVVWVIAAVWLWDGISVYLQRDDDEARWL